MFQESDATYWINEAITIQSAEHAGQEIAADISRKKAEAEAKKKGRRK
jgi:hypothetical protein